MNDFLCWNDWWSQRYRYKLGEGVRYFSMKTALNVFHQRGGENIVETGTIRALNDFAGGGWSTMVLGDYAQWYGKNFWTVDILPDAIELSKRITTGHQKNTTFVTSDSVTFLRNFRHPIDFLYLDSMDCPENASMGNPALVQSQEHQLNELKAAWDKLHDKSVILLDDNNFANGGKCRLSIRFLEYMHWTNLINDKQSLWIL